LSKRLRRAQNDVLSTVGVCTNTEKDGKLPSGLNGLISVQGIHDDPNYEKLVDENESALFIGILEDTLNGLATSFVESLRKRIQVSL
jgi:hypothetical protein